MRDVLPGESHRLSFVSDAIVHTLQRFGYDEIRLPLVESTTLFSHGVGESTDIVSKEMYTLEDSDGASLSLRPEGTASCVRAAINGNLVRGNKPRLYYTGSMFRHERPQKGRYREFHQVGAEVFGYCGPDVDVELIAICHQAFHALDVGAAIEIEINTLGSAASRRAYRSAFVQFLKAKEHLLDDDSQRRLATNPLRILDTKDSSTRELLADAPPMAAYLDAESQAHFDGIRAGLAERNVPYLVNPQLVRGLDYYTHLVFEFNTDLLGAQRQVGGGGRYDGLFELLGGTSTPAAGFALGIDRLALLHEELHGDAETQSNTDCYVIAVDDAQLQVVSALCRELRSQTTCGIQEHHGGGTLKNKMRTANRSGARWVLLVGEEELKGDVVSVKWLREERPQVSVPRAELSDYITKIAG